MVRKIAFVLSVVLLVALAACSVPPRSSTTASCDTNGTLPEIDEIGVGDGIDAATAVLGTEPVAADMTKPVAKPETTTKPTTAPKDTVTKTVTEGDIVSFPNLKATDPDGDPITYTFAAPLGKDGKWQTKSGDAGEYVVTITASDGKNSVSQKVTVIVKPGNRPPVVSGPSTITVNEGENVALAQELSDPDGDKVTATYSGWMNQQIKATVAGDAGDHVVMVTATDGKLTTTKNVTVKVVHVNRAPVLSAIDAVTATEGDKMTVVPKATDADSDTLTFTYGKPLDASGVWQTKKGDAGSYTATVTVSDGKATDSKNVSVTVVKLNLAPVISDFVDLSVNEGETVKLVPKVTDPENDKVILIFTGWMTSATKATASGDAGTNEVTLTATDAAGNSAKKTIKVTVVHVNRAPVFDPAAFG